MNRKNRLIQLFFLLGLSQHNLAQSLPVQWHHLDPQTDSVMGISTDRAYRELLTGRKPTPIIIADMGTVDINHEDLKRVIWTNPKEIAGNGKDDDGNGYADDLHGWNFVGNPSGETLPHDTFEETRLVAKLQPLYDGKARDAVPAAKQAEFELYKQAKASFDRKVGEFGSRYQNLLRTQTQLTAAIATLKKSFTLTRLDSALLHHPPTTDTTLLRLANLLYRPMAAMGYADADDALTGLNEAVKKTKNAVEYGLNLHYDARSVVGDNPADLTERRYGNADVVGTSNRHGTHTTGIMAADRQNDAGVRGIADAVRVMAVSMAADGDERDKNVANGIRYAVDNGAKVINMSFGKEFSPDRQVVDAAIRYAETKGVLLVHSAGNSHFNVDSVASFPAATYPDGTEMMNMITVGASSRLNNRELVAVFSNYGKNSVDVFAPGVAILSTVPNNGYEPSSGTSMAGPVVAGVAAVLKSYFPKLTPQQIKRIIVASARPIHTMVYKPGTKTLVDFTSLSKSGGIVNLYEAVKLALAGEGTTSRR